MKVLFITSLVNLEIVGDLGRGDKITQEIFITNNHKKIKSILTPGLELMIGVMETLTLLESKAVIYSIQEFSEKDFDPIPHLNMFMRDVSVFLQALWFVKDNSVNFELGFLEAPYKKSDARITSNCMNNIFTNSQGESTLTAFTKKELKGARQRFREDFLIDEESLVETSKYQTLIIKGSSRVERAVYFLQTARISNDIGIRIAQYCSCFEALFATDSAELSHKLSERVGHFLGVTAEEKRELYYIVKNAYNIRSKSVHGDVLSNRNVDELGEVSFECDRILRLILCKIYDTPFYHHLFFNGKKEELEQYFTDLIFGIQQRMQVDG